MDRMRRIAGMGKNKVRSQVQKDEDESIVFFRELHRHEKHADVNLLDPMYSVEFDSIKGGHASKPPSSGKRDSLIAVDEKHDYDWLSTPPAAPLFPSIEMEASSYSVLRRPAHSSASRFSGKPPPAAAATSKASARPPPPPPDRRRCAMEKRPSYTAVGNRHHKEAAPAAAACGGAATAKKKHPGSCAGGSHGSGGASPAVAPATEAPGEAPYVPPKNLLTAGPLFARRAPSTTAPARGASRTRDAPPAVGTKVEGGGKARMPAPCTPAAGSKGQLRDGSPVKGKTAVEPGCDGGGGGRAAGEPAMVKGIRRRDGKMERRPRFAAM